MHLFIYYGNTNMATTSTICICMSQVNNIINIIIKSLKTTKATIYIYIYICEIRIYIYIYTYTHITGILYLRCVYSTIYSFYCMVYYLFVCLLIRLWHQFCCYLLSIFCYFLIYNVLLFIFGMILLYVMLIVDIGFNYFYCLLLIVDIRFKAMITTLLLSYNFAFGSPSAKLYDSREIRLRTNKTTEFYLKIAGPWPRPVSFCTMVLWPRCVLVARNTYMLQHRIVATNIILL